MTTHAAMRPTSLPAMGAAMGKLFDRATVARSVAAYRPRPTDVIISPFGKCGTTWLQQIFHTLRTGGDMDFDDISRVVPWIETAELLGLDINSAQRAEPRGFKSHLAFDDLPPGAKGIVSLRDPRDAFVSMYRFAEGWFFERGSISIEEFAATWVGGPDDGGNGYWRHLLSWWSQRDNPDVLVLSYAAMTDDPEGHIRKVAAFCGLKLDEALLAKALEQSSLDFMLAHKDRFDDAMMRRASEEIAGLPPGGDSSKVRKGGTGQHAYELSPELIAAFDAKWERLVAPSTGFADFAALDAAVRGL
jgi:Sulfotransferase domain